MATKKTESASKPKAAKKAASPKSAATKSAGAKKKTTSKAVPKAKAKAAIEPEVVLGGVGDGAKVLVTGGTGFLGRHIVTALQHAGYSVRALCRSSDDELQKAGVEVVRGDVTQPETVAAAMRGIDFVVHAAGAVSRDEGSVGRAWMMRVHVAGTRHVMEAACTEGVRRVVHVSTSGTVAVGEDPDMVFHEDDPVPLETIHQWPYYLSKFLAERAATDVVRLAAKSGGAVPELVTLNPSLALGPGDRRKSSTQDIQRYLDGQIPVIPSGGLSFVDVRDVASAVVSALSKGTPGARYLLGALNCTCEDFFSRVGEVSGATGPLLPIKIPGKWATFGVGLLERAADLVGAKPSVSKVEADMARHYWYVDARKAEQELGFAPRPPMDTLLDTVRDLRGETRPQANAFLA